MTSGEVGRVEAVELFDDEFEALLDRGDFGEDGPDLRLKLLDLDRINSPNSLIDEPIVRD